MSEKSIRPSTLEGIRSLAGTFKKARCIKHARALDEAARAAGYNNYAHAVSALSRKSAVATSKTIWITARWNVRKAGLRGRETLALELPQALEAVVTPSQARHDRYLGDMRLDAPDHLVSQSIAGNQEQARQWACQVARSLQFMAATGLKPSSARRAYPKRDWDNRVPDRDHGSTWWDPRFRRHVLADEPYVDADGPISEERLRWASRHGWEIVKPRWPGMYRPDGGCHLFLMTDLAKGPSLAGQVEALERSPHPVFAVEANWSSGSFHDPFISPGTIASIEAKTAKAPVPRRAPRKRASTAYNMTFVGRRLRPNVRMPISAHQEVGRLLKSLLVAAERRDGVRNRVDWLRSELDEWVMREYSYEELDQETFSELYYHEHDGPEWPVISRDEMISRLQRAKTILIRHYPDCPPLDLLLGKANKAISSLRSWAI